MADLRVQRPEFHHTPNCSENILSQLYSSWVFSRDFDGGGIHNYIRIVLENTEAVI
jgi:hypothetical protein